MNHLDKNSKITRFAALLLLLVGLAGCGEKDVVVEANSDRMVRLFNCYLMFAEGNNMKGPINEQELKQFLMYDQGIQPRLERMGVTVNNMGEMFFSERDNEKFKIRWGLEGLTDQAIVFEAVGVNGKRLVGFSKPREVGEAEYAGLSSGKIKPSNSNDSITVSGPMTKD